MIRLYECLRYEHDWRLVVLAAIVCLACSFTASVILKRAKSRRGARHLIWLATLSLVAGFGIWATHFVAMLAYEPGVGFGFDLVRTIASFLIIILICFPAFALISNTQKRIVTALGGLLLGCGISTMHYIGMAGLLPAGYMVWDQSFIATSIILGSVFSVFSFEFHRMYPNIAGELGCALLLTATICTMHFLGMSAVTLIPFEDATNIQLGISPALLGTLIGALAIMVIQGGFLFALLDSWREKKSHDDAYKLLKQEALLSSMGEVAKIGAWELDVNSMVPKWSLQTRNLHQVDAAYQPSIEQAAEFFPGKGKGRFLRAVERACKEEKGFDIELPFRSSLGEKLWVRVMCSILTKENGNVKLIGAYQDISRQYLERKVLKKALAEADNANKLKSEFLANMSHEIRTPLNGVLGMAQILSKTSLDEKQKRYADTICSSGKSLLSLINDVLDISKMEAGLLKLEEEPFTLDELLQSVEDSVLGIALQKGITLTHHNKTTGIGRYCGDIQRLRQVLINLAGNAVKFTDEGSVTIFVSELMNGNLLFSVNDTGPGIAQDQQAAVFKRFTQADGSATRKHGGTGLGLAISEDLVNLMGGTIGLESELGKGTTFWFQVPLQILADLQQETPRAAKPAPRLNPQVVLFDDEPGDQNDEDDAPYEAADSGPFRVLVAEDNLVNQEMIVEILKLLEDTKVEIVENGAEALKALEKDHYDLVLMDINMPVMTGDEAIKHIRASHAAYKDVPIIVLTANAIQGQEAEYRKAGATGYLSKPIDVDELLANVKNYHPNASVEETQLARAG